MITYFLTFNVLLTSTLTIARLLLSGLSCSLSSLAVLAWKLSIISLVACFNWLRKDSSPNCPVNQSIGGVSCYFLIRWSFRRYLMINTYFLLPSIQATNPISNIRYVKPFTLVFPKYFSMFQVSTRSISVIHKIQTSILFFKMIIEC